MIDWFTIGGNAGAHSSFSSFVIPLLHGGGPPNRSWFFLTPPGQHESPFALFFLSDPRLLINYAPNPQESYRTYGSELTDRARELEQSLLLLDNPSTSDIRDRLSQIQVLS